MTTRVISVLLSSHLAAAAVGWLVKHFSQPQKIEMETSEMANKFESILKDVGKGLLFLFTNKTAEGIEAGSLNMAALIWPGLSSLFSRLAAAIANAQAQALVSTAGMTPAQIVALVLADVQADLQTAGVTETAQQIAIINAAIQFIDTLPSGSVNAAVVAAAVKSAAATVPATPAPVTAIPAETAPAAVAIAPAAPALEAPVAVAPAIVTKAPLAAA